MVRFKRDRQRNTGEKACMLVCKLIVYDFIPQGVVPEPVGILLCQALRACLHPCQGVLHMGQSRIRPT